MYKTPEGEAEIRALYDEALAGLGLGYESLTVGTRLGDTHVIALGPEGAPPLLPAPCAGNTREHRTRYPRPNSPMKDPRYPQSPDPDNGLPRTLVRITIR